MARFIVIATAVASAAFVLWLARGLPEFVASNFGLGGRVNSHMPRALFVGIMLIGGSLLPLAVWLLQCRAARRGRYRMRAATHWYAPSQRARTVAFLEAHVACFSVAFTIFMTYVYWLAVAANAALARAAPFDTGSFLVALVGLFAFVAVWLAGLFWRFRTPG
ncbi:MAG: hypothetical protein OEY03_06140 [Rhizobacter sp.]|nr:hypothetical protein [Rhizobacter sp.]